MILRQTYLDPFRNRLEIKEVELRLEDVRLAGEVHPKIRIIGFCHELSNMAEPIDQINYIMDSKRTYCPPSIPMTRILRQFDKTIVCYDHSSSGLDARIGDPVSVIYSSDNITHGLITEIREEGVDVFFAKPPKIIAGGIIQNLRNSSFIPNTNLGINSRFSQPEGLGLVAHVNKGGIMIMVTPPLNPGRMKCFDIYVRDKPFNVIDPFWFPDCYDQDIAEEQIIVTTYNGGEEAGGGTLVQGKSYWITAIAKDSKGFLRVNESPAQFIEKIKISD